MNKPAITIAAMVAVATALGAAVLWRDRPAAAAAAVAAPSAGQASAHDGHAAPLIALSAAQIKGAAIAVNSAGPARIDTFIRLPGDIKLNEERSAHISAGVDGVVQAVQARLGDQVRHGALLAAIASPAVAQQRSEVAASEQKVRYARSIVATEKQLWEEKISARQDLGKAELSLHEAELALLTARQKLAVLDKGRGQPGAAEAVSNRLELRAPLAGLVVEQHIAAGETVAADTRLYTIADLATVWAEVVVPARELGIVRVGTRAVVRSSASTAVAVGKVSYVSALIGAQTRSAQARVVLANAQLAWRPGLFVEVDIVTGAATVAVAVASDALQTVDGRQVVYRKVAGGFTAQAVTTGRSDGQVVEIVSGLAAGDQYAASGSFVIKAEQGKGEAGHAD